MSAKQTFLEAAARLPETASWQDVCEMLYQIADIPGSPPPDERMRMARMHPDELGEYILAKGGVPLEEIAAKFNAELRRLSEKHAGPPKEELP